ncbi:MAG: PRC-barrel domain-containing protein [Verrucomicrobiota bacterium]
MLTKVKTLDGYSIQNTKDETIGKVQDVYFDDRHWTVRYLVANTGKWLTGRQVLVSPYALVAVNADHENVVADLTKKQIEDSPSLESDKPVSRQFESDYYGYYGWPAYWYGPYSWGNYPYLERDHAKRGKHKPGEKAWDHHLRSSHEVTGYHIQAEDGEIGHVEDFVIDDETWEIRYIIVNTSNWWAGKKVLISPLWIKHVSWSEQKVVIDFSREAIKRSPEFTDESLLTRDYEINLYGHYNRKGYWIDELVAS